MTKEEAIKVAYGIPVTKVQHEALRFLIPELRESDGEKIRKGLLTAFQKMNGWWNGMLVSGILAWLEKQKEQKPDIEICPHSVKSKSYSETGYPIEDCDYGLEIALDILEKTLGKVYGFQTDDGIREHETAIKAVKDAMKKQKPFNVCEQCPYYKDCPDYNEQNPAEWSEEDETRLTNILIMLKEYVIHHYSKDDVNKSVDWLENRFKSLRPQPREEIYQSAKHDLAIKFMNYLDENRPEGKMSLSNGECEDIDKAFKENDWAKIMRYIEKYRSQPKQEWSKEDEKMLLSIVNAFRNGTVSTIGQEQWLKSLPERFNLQPKQEWSEEDERMRNQLISDIEHHKKDGLISAKQNKATKALYNGIEKCYDEKIAWLKSRRSPFKPSKEQMEALEECGECKRPIKELREQLKKL